MVASDVLLFSHGGNDNGSIIKRYDAAIDKLKAFLKRNKESLEKLKIVQTLKTLVGEDLSRINAEVIQCDWLVRQNAFQLQFKTLERQIVRMFLAKTFKPVKKVFLERYDEMCYAMHELYEEGVSLNEMTESDYLEMADDIMKFRNGIQKM